MKEPDVEEITGRHARPDHGFLKVPEIDDNMPGSGHWETPSESAYKEGQNVGQHSGENPQSWDPWVNCGRPWMRREGPQMTRWSR